SASAALPFDVLVSYDVLESIRQASRDPNAQPPRENFLNGSAITYLLLPADGRITVESLRAQLGASAERHVPPEMAAFAKLGFGAIPVSALLGNAVDGELFAFGGGDLSVAGVLMVLATVVLAVACVNYANLATARAARRVREVGLRKALGA